MAALATLYAENSAGQPRASTAPASKSLRNASSNSSSLHLGEAVDIVQLLLQLLASEKLHQGVQCIFRQNKTLVQSSDWQSPL